MYVVIHTRSTASFVMYTLQNTGFFEIELSFSPSLQDNGISKMKPAQLIFWFSSKLSPLDSCFTEPFRSEREIVSPVLSFGLLAQYLNMATCQEFLSTRAFNQVPNIRNKRLNQSHFWSFTPRQLVGDIFCLISSSQLNLANTIPFRKDQRCLPVHRYKIHWPMVRNKHFTAPQKLPNFNFQNVQIGHGAKQSYFSYSLDKTFHLSEFQAKLFFTRN